MSRSLPTLSTDGLVSSVQRKMDRLFAYYRVSQASQSIIYDGKILSFPKRMEEYDSDILKLQQNIQNDIDLLFGRHFELYEAQVKIIDHPNEKGQYLIRFVVTVNENGKVYNLSEAVDIIDGKIKRVEGIT